MKGRNVPPIHIISEGPRMTVAEALAKVQTQPGCYMLEVQHDDGCPTIRTQRDTDCICEPVYKLWTLKGRA